MRSWKSTAGIRPLACAFASLVIASYSGEAMCQFTMPPQATKKKTPAASPTPSRTPSAASGSVDINLDGQSAAVAALLARDDLGDKAARRAAQEKSMRRTISQLDVLAQSNSGEEAKFFSNVSKSMTRIMEMAKALGPHEDRINDSEYNFTLFQTVPESVKVVEERKVAFRDWEAAHKPFETLPSEMLETFGTLPESKQKFAQVVITMSRIAEFGLKAAPTVSQNAQQCLDLLKAHWGKWRFDAKTHEVVLGPDFPKEDAARYKQSWDSVRKIEKDMKALQQYMKNASSAGAKP